MKLDRLHMPSTSFPGWQKSLVRQTVLRFFSVASKGRGAGCCLTVQLWTANYKYLQMNLQFKFMHKTVKQNIVAGSKLITVMKASEEDTCSP
jgi:hypothetical protein